MSETLEQSNLDLEGQLAEAKNIFRESEAALKATPEFKEVTKAMNRISHIQVQIKAEEKQKANLVKKEILASGFEVRTTMEDDYLFIILHKSHPKIFHIQECDKGLLVYTRDPICTDEHDPESSDVSKQEWLLGYGKTEKEAWKHAIENWSNPVNQTAKYPH